MENIFFSTPKIQQLLNYTTKDIIKIKLFTNSSKTRDTPYLKTQTDIISIKGSNINCPLLSSLKGVYNDRYKVKTKYKKQ